MTLVPGFVGASHICIVYTQTLQDKRLIYICLFYCLKMLHQTMVDQRNTVFFF